MIKEDEICGFFERMGEPDRFKNSDVVYMILIAIVGVLFSFFVPFFAVVSCRGDAGTVFTSPPFVTITKDNKVFNVKKCETHWTDSNITVTHFDGTVEIIEPPYLYKRK
jgi:hypothetical protein